MPLAEGEGILTPVKENVMLTFYVHVTGRGNPDDWHSIFGCLSKEFLRDKTAFTKTHRHYLICVSSNRMKRQEKYGFSPFARAWASIVSCTTPGSSDVGQNLHHQCSGSWLFGLRLELVP